MITGCHNHIVHFYLSSYQTIPANSFQINITVAFSVAVLFTGFIILIDWKLPFYVAMYIASLYNLCNASEGNDITMNDINLASHVSPPGDMAKGKTLITLTTKSSGDVYVIFI